MRVLILSITAGQGHNSCGSALQGALITAGHQAMLVDTLGLSSRAASKLLNSVYIGITRINPRLMCSMIDNISGKEHETERRRTVTLIQKVIGPMFESRVRRTISDFAPDIIVCTHVYSALVISHMKQHDGFDIPLVGINTDFVMAPMWENSNVDHIVIASKAMIPECRANGIPEHKLLPYGIPVHRRFEESLTREEARAILGLEDKPTVLIMSGSMGFGDIPKTIAELDVLTHDFQIVAVCGNNRKAYQRIAQMHTRHYLSTYGFVDNIQMFMDAADIIISKPGGLSASECLAKGRALVLMDPIPGIEEGNSDFLAGCGAALKTSNAYPIHRAVDELMNDPDLMESIVACQSLAGCSGAARALVNKLEAIAAKQG